MGPKPVLLVQHAPAEHPAALGRALDALGVRTHILHPYRGDAYPSVSEVSGIVSLGGSMGANDEASHPWILGECRFLRHCVENELPAIGICLGAQLMARALGGVVERHPIPELGWHHVKLNEEGAGDALASAAGVSPRVYQWHYDTFHLPPGAVLLADSDGCAKQAFRIGRHAYGFQFHVEADSAHVRDWLSLAGAEGEIIRSLENHGPATVQHPELQRAMGVDADRSSGILSAAIASHFDSPRASSPEAVARESLLEWADTRVSLAVGLRGPGDDCVSLSVRVVALVSIPTGEFAILRDESSRLWPVRRDRFLWAREADEAVRR